MKTITQKEYCNIPQIELNVFTGIVNWDDGTVTYYKNGLLHREDGPAFETLGGYKVWLVEGQYHNLKGPAKIWSSGYKEYFIYGHFYTKKQYKTLVNFMKYKDLV